MTKIKYAFLLPLILVSLHAWPHDKGQCERSLTAQAPIAARFQADPLRQALAGALEAVIRAKGVALNAEAIEKLFTSPPKPEMGQIAFPTFQLAKALKMAPPKIAEALKAELVQGAVPMVAKVENAGPYVNFHIDFAAYLTWMNEAQKQGRFFMPELRDGEREKISLEFSQPNTHKALHVGHMRNMFLGEAVARLLEFGGHQVVRSTYPGDMGTHVAKALWYIHTHKKNEIPAAADAEWLGRMYAEADQFIKDHADSAEVKSGIEAMLKGLESRVGEDYQFYCQTREWSLDQMRAVYQWLGIKFDQWYFESECDAPSRQLVQDKRRQGILVEDDGAVGLDLKKENLGFVLMLKKDGSGLYLTKDLELLRQKFNDPSVTRSIVVVDARQKLHFQQVFRAAELMGFPKARQSLHLSYETVNDREGKAFSSRALNGGLGLWQLKETLDKGPDAAMAVNNLRWGFLKVAPTDQIRFDMEQWLARTGNSAGELLELSRQLAQQDGKPAPNRELSVAEKAIVAQLAGFHPATAKAIQELDPSEIARYLLDLQGLLRKWQGESPEGHSQIAAAASRILAQGLQLLGISEN